MITNKVMDNRNSYILLSIMVMAVTIEILIGETGLAILTSILPLFILYSINNPNYAMILFLISPLLPSLMRDSLNLPIINEISVFFAFACIVLFANYTLKPSFRIKWPSKLLLLMFLLSIVILIGSLRAFFSGDVPLVRSLITNFLSQIILMSGIYIISYNYFIHSEDKKEIWVIYAVFFLIICSFFIDRFIYGFDKLRSGYLVSGNLAGSVLVISLPMFYFLKKTFKKWKSALNLLIILSIITISLSLSRSSILALFLITTLYIFFRLRQRWSIKIFVPFIMVVLLLVLWSNPLMKYYRDIPEFTSPEMIQFSMGRISIWGYAIDYLRDPIHFWVGGGTNDFLKYADAEYRLGPIGVHNHFLRIWLDYGLIGLLLVFCLYISILFIAIRGIYSNSKELIALSWSVIYSTLAVFVVGSFFHFEIGSQNISMYWICVGWLIAVKDIEKNNLKKLKKIEI